MELTMKTALDTMGVMQTEWDAAVEANQAEPARALGQN